MLKCCCKHRPHRWRFQSKNPPPDFGNGSILLLQTPLISMDGSRERAGQRISEASRLTTSLWRLAPTNIRWPLHTYTPPTTTTTTTLPLIYNTLHTHAWDFPSDELDTEFPLLNHTISVGSDGNSSFSCLLYDSEVKRQLSSLAGIQTWLLFCLWGDVNAACQREVEVDSTPGG